MAETTKNFPTNISNPFLFETSTTGCLHEIRHRASAAILHHKLKQRALLIDLVITTDVKRRFKKQAAHPKLVIFDGLVFPNKRSIVGCYIAMVRVLKIQIKYKLHLQLTFLATLTFRRRLISSLISSISSSDSSITLMAANCPVLVWRPCTRGRE